MRRRRSRIGVAIVIVVTLTVHFGFLVTGAVAAESGESAARSAIPAENLKIPEPMRACAASLQKIHAAIKEYEKDNGDLPKWLSDLVPDYLGKEVLLCPDNADRSEAPYHPDPKLPCSYTYEFSPETRDWKERQVRDFRNVVPIVRCIDHGSEMVLNLSVGGQVYWSALVWEQMFTPASRAGQLKLTGVVRDEADTPVAGAELTVLPFSGDRVASDSQGNFALNWEARELGGRQTLHYLVARHEPRNLAATAEIDEQTKTVDVKLAPGVIFAGKVMSPDGKGIAGARIMTILWESNYGSHLSGADGQTDADGKFEVRAIPLDRKYTMMASAEGYGQSQVQIHTDEAVENRVDVGGLTLAVADLSVSGLVVDANDKPVPDVRVYCYGGTQPNRNARTDAQGKFTIDKVCKGPIRVAANTTDPGRLYGYVETEGGASDIKIVVSERVSVSRFVPREPASLVGKPLPDLKGLGIELPPGDARDKMLLVCFWDMQQRPSRHCIRQLAEQAELLKQKEVTIVAVQASKIQKGALADWAKKYDIPFPIGMIEDDAEKIQFAWGVKSLPWLILTDRQHIVSAEGFGLNQVNEKIKEANSVAR